MGVMGVMGAATLPLLGPGSLRAAPDPQVFPPSETFRKLRLITLTCGRENTAESCDSARALADPLLDHPRLPASCKDALWAIRQRATVAPSNSFSRRDPIDQAAQDLLVFCRQQQAEAKEKTGGGGPGSAGGLRLIGPGEN
jgi:hypothetical protein